MKRRSAFPIMRLHLSESTMSRDVRLGTHLCHSMVNLVALHIIPQFRNIRPRGPIAAAEPEARATRHR